MQWRDKRCGESESVMLVSFFSNWYGSSLDDEEGVLHVLMVGDGLHVQTHGLVLVVRFDRGRDCRLWVLTNLICFLLNAPWIAMTQPLPVPPYAANFTQPFGSH